MGERISLILSLYLALLLPAALLFNVNKWHGWAGVLAQASIILWPVATVVCLFRINYSDLRVFESGDEP